MRGRLTEVLISSSNASVLSHAEYSVNFEDEKLWNSRLNEFVINGYLHAHYKLIRGFVNFLFHLVDDSLLSKCYLMKIFS